MVNKFYGFAAFGFTLVVGSTAHGSASDFVTALEAIKKNNPEVIAERLHAKGVESGHLSDRLYFLPTVDGSVAQRWSHPYADRTSQYQQGDLSSSLNIFRFGSDWANDHAARADQSVAWSNASAKELQIESQAAEVLIDLIAKTLRIEILKRLVATREISLEVGVERFKRGLLPDQEVSAIRVDLANAKAELSNLEIAHARAQAELKALNANGETIEAKMEWPWAGELLQSRSDTLLKAELLLPELPGWKANSALTEKLDQLAKSSYRKMLPSLDGSFDLGVERHPSDTSKYWVAGVTLTIPVFDRMKNYSNARQNEAEASSQKQILVNFENHAQANWSGDHQALKISLESLNDRLKTLAISRSLYDDNVRRFRLGRASANDLTIDIGRLSDSETLVLEGESAVYSNFSKVCHDLGKPFSQCASL